MQLHQRKEPSCGETTCEPLDLKSAYDRVSRPLLWLVLQRLGIHGRMLAAIQALYSTATVAVRINGRRGPAMPSLTGVKQGCPLSPTLFGLYADGLPRFLHAFAATEGIRVGAHRRIIDLGYADDFALVSPTTDGLQRLIDAADAWSAAMDMRISAEKTVCMEMVGAAVQGHVWQCAAVDLQTVDQVKYLGVYFSTASGFQPTFDDLHKKACAARAIMLRNYGRLDCDRNIWLQLQMFRACVLPVSLFASEWWGMYQLRGVARQSREQLAQQYLSQIKALAGLRISVATSIVWAELQQLPLQYLWLFRAATLWNSLSAGPGLYADVLSDAVRLAGLRVRNWVHGFKHHLAEVGYAFSPSDMRAVDLRMLHQVVDQHMQRCWQGLSVSPRTAPSDGARLCTYFRWIADDRHNAQRVIGLRLPYRVVNRFLRFRTGCHGLPSDVGAHQGVPRERRFCTLCRQGVGDELHLVFECAALQDLRAQMPGIFLGVTTMRGFMQQRDIRSVATFISTAVKRVQDMT